MLYILLAIWVIRVRSFISLGPCHVKPCPVTMHHLPGIQQDQMDQQRVLGRIQIVIRCSGFKREGSLRIFSCYAKWIVLHPFACNEVQDSLCVLPERVLLYGKNSEGSLKWLPRPLVRFLLTIRWQGPSIRHSSSSLCVSDRVYNSCVEWLCWSTPCSDLRFNNRIRLIWDNMNVFGRGRLNCTFK